jgi:hypothetical protein
MKVENFMEQPLTYTIKNGGHKARRCIPGIKRRLDHPRKRPNRKINREISLDSGFINWQFILPVTYLTGNKYCQVLRP